MALSIIRAQAIPQEKQMSASVATSEDQMTKANAQSRPQPQEPQKERYRETSSEMARRLLRELEELQLCEERDEERNDQEMLWTSMS